MPHTLDEGLTTEIVTRFALSFEHTFDDHLCGDTGMISAGLPQGVVAKHPVISNEGIHQRILKGMPHVQAAGHIGWRDGNTISRAIASRSEIITRFPLLVYAFLDRVRVVGLIELFGAHRIHSY